MPSVDYKYINKHKDVSEFNIPPDCSYIYGESVEKRSCHVEPLKQRCVTPNYVKISKNENSNSLSISGKDEIFSLRSSNGLKSFIAKYCPSEIVYIDVTGLKHSVWAILLRSLIYEGKVVRAIYVEPHKYNIEEFQSEGVIHDLSEKIKGIQPLPGFASFSRSEDDSSFFIPLLGFEGARFKYMLEKVQPMRGQVKPVIGVPGFRAEYPFVAYWGNRQPLTESQSWNQLVYVTANSPVDVFRALDEIHKSHPDNYLVIAPIGTKPHAIGAILYAIKNPSFTELIYDHPVRNKPRTEGTAYLIELSVSEMIKEV